MTQLLRMLTKPGTGGTVLVVDPDDDGSAGDPAELRHRGLGDRGDAAAQQLRHAAVRIGRAIGRGGVCSAPVAVVIAAAACGGESQDENKRNADVV
jgi:hypothetical protein